MTLQTGQAAAQISSTHKNAYGQARAKIRILGQRGIGQSQADIRAVGQQFAQAQTLIVGYLSGYAQAQALIKRSIGFGQAQGYIVRSDAGRLVKFNNYVLPGYLQS
jgi:hypothetical protein